MAHDFEIRTKDKKRTAYFFGYCNAVMYRAFHHPECDAGISGCDAKFTITKNETLRGLSKAIRLFDRSHYPDPTRMDDIKSFYTQCLADSDDTEYVIWFC